LPIPIGAVVAYNIDMAQLTIIELNDAGIANAERVAKRLGYTQTAYDTTSDLPGLHCLPNSESHKAGTIIRTAEFGFMFVQDLEDLKFHDLI
jgi:hypothetical protein